MNAVPVDVAGGLPKGLRVVVVDDDDDVEPFEYPWEDLFGGGRFDGGPLEGGAPRDGGGPRGVPLDEGGAPLDEGGAPLDPNLDDGAPRDEGVPRGVGFPREEPRFARRA